MADIRVETGPVGRAMPRAMIVHLSEIGDRMWELEAAVEADGAVQLLVRPDADAGARHALHAMPAGGSEVMFAAGTLHLPAGGVLIEVQDADGRPVPGLAAWVDLAERRWAPVARLRGDGVDGDAGPAGTLLDVAVGRPAIARIDQLDGHTRTACISFFDEHGNNCDARPTASGTGPLLPIAKALPSPELGPPGPFTGRPMLSIVDASPGALHLLLDDHGLVAELVVARHGEALSVTRPARLTDFGPVRVVVPVPGGGEVVLIARDAHGEAIPDLTAQVEAEARRFVGFHADPAVWGRVLVIGAPLDLERSECAGCGGEVRVRDGVALTDLSAAERERVRARVAIAPEGRLLCRECHARIVRAGTWWGAVAAWARGRTGAPDPAASLARALPAVLAARTPAGRARAVERALLHGLGALELHVYAGGAHVRSLGAPPPAEAPAAVARAAAGRTAVIEHGAVSLPVRHGVVYHAPKLRDPRVLDDLRGLLEVMGALAGLDQRAD